MKIHPIITDNPLQNIFYILEYGDKEALIIDPCDIKMAQDFLDEHQLKLQRILITHEHSDHYEGVPGLTYSEVYAGEIAASNMPIEISYIFEDEEIVFEFEDVQIKALFTPGHAAGHMMFELREDKRVSAIFSGDVLFAGGVGHTRNGSSEDLYLSVQKFGIYDNDVIIYSGHDYLENNFKFTRQYFPKIGPKLDTILNEKQEGVYFTTLGQERSVNPFIFSSKEAFIELRELKNNS